ncbi:ROK family transcriptional regulator [Streptantibioticus ferralitis]|uniref:ROK family transcriptional regulator n=1 Tax=Streptantibioticus ferralitis TaxID=236510 RepID=A0ABT5ZBW7_9ACTN|nr:ROK family transcriptional regulator [Streptantibioticus ferralitis]MDF2261342.1 ROK family transcriptional regulator [Streptantibioticus ferralitis]
MGRLTGGDPSLLRRINSAVVLHTLRGERSRTLTELVRATGLSRPTVEGVIEGLTGSGLVVEAPADPGDVRRQGRPARRFRFHAEAGHLLGIEIGVHQVRVVLADLSGRVLDSLGHDLDGLLPADDRLERVRVAVADLLRGSGVARSTLWAVGVGSPGIVESDGTVRLGTAMPGWTGLPLGDRLRRSFRCPVLVENDANAAAVAEHWMGAAHGSDDIVFVMAGLSPGAGSLIGGRLHRGFGGAAGEIGALHLLGREATPERLLSTTGTPLDPLDEPAVTRVFGLAREGDPRAREAVERFLRRLVHDVAALVLALDPELVVLGGWAAGLDGVLEPLRDELARYCLRPPKVALSALGEEAVAIGALRLALDHVEEQLFAVEQAAPARP